jgi:hypothetical protein
MTTLVSDLASAYLRLRSLDQELEIARRTLDSRRGSLDLVRRRESGGVAGLIDVRQSNSGRTCAWRRRSRRPLVSITLNVAQVPLPAGVTTPLK